MVLVSPTWLFELLLCLLLMSWVCAALVVFQKAAALNLTSMKLRQWLRSHGILSNIELPWSQLSQSNFNFVEQINLLFMLHPCSPLYGTCWQSLKCENYLHSNIVPKSGTWSNVYLDCWYQQTRIVLKCSDTW